MKKIWEKPNLNKLGVKSTEEVKPIIFCNIKGDIQLVIDPLYGWKCPCCLKDSGYAFANKELAEDNFYNVHLPSCEKYDIAKDSCIIS